MPGLLWKLQSPCQACSDQAARFKSLATRAGFWICGGIGCATTATGYTPACIPGWFLPALRALHLHWRNSFMWAGPTAFEDGAHWGWDPEEQGSRASTYGAMFGWKPMWKPGILSTTGFSLRPSSMRATSGWSRPTKHNHWRISNGGVSHGNWGSAQEQGCGWTSGTSCSVATLHVLSVGQKACHPQWCVGGFIPPSLSLSEGGYLCGLNHGRSKATQR